MASTAEKMKKRIDDMNKISIQSCSFNNIQDFKPLEIVAVKIDGNW